MLAIKLQRIGRKHQPSYRVVVAEKKSKLGGPPVEDLGSYDSFSKKNTINKERVKYWIGVGAKPTPTVHNLLLKNQAIEGKKVKINVRPSKKAPVAPTPAAAVALEVKNEDAAAEKEAPTPAEGGDGVPTLEGVGKEAPKD
ncbi:MAG: 30S ribosomal protein S16 [bacterium]|nr:30S ribosomal protein S16 [bacterium]